MDRRTFLRMMGAAPPPVFDLKFYTANVVMWRNRQVEMTDVVLFEAIEKEYKECARGDEGPSYGYFNWRLYEE